MNFMQYPVPYVQQPVEIMGRKAADLLLEQLEKKEALSQVCKYPAYLVKEINIFIYKPLP